MMKQVKTNPAILVVKLSSLGDLFHTLPAVRQLKVGLDATIDWVVQREYVGVVKCFPDVREVIPFDRFPYFAGLRKFYAEMANRRYDYVVDAQGLMKSAMVALVARGGLRIGPSYHREGSWWLYDRVAGRRNKARHAVEENLDIVKWFGLAPSTAEFPVRFPSREVTGRRPRVALLPASRWTTKNWPKSCFADVGKRIRAERNASIFLLGSRDDVEACEWIARELGDGVVNMAGKTGLPELGGVLKQMDLLIANDSGPIHMAAAVGTPVLVVFGPTDHVRTGPYGDAHRVVTAKIDCRPCFSRQCRREDVACLSGVTPEHVSVIAGEMLSDTANKR